MKSDFKIRHSAYLGKPVKEGGSQLDCESKESIVSQLHNELDSLLLFVSSSFFIFENFLKNSLCLYCVQSGIKKKFKFQV